MINNFILLYYPKKDWSILSKGHQEYYKDFIPKAEHINLRLLKLMLMQLYRLYKDANIHILTNSETLPECPNKLIAHYDSSLPSHHLSKLKIYGLLDEPAMYLDTDIIINQHFQPAHLATGNPFNLYRKYHSDCMPCRKVRETVSGVELYNCAIIWIKKPSKQIEIDLQNINQEYFSGKAYNDEFVVGVYVHKNKLKMKSFDGVNSERFEVSDDNFQKCQTVHYTGLQKPKLFADYLRRYHKVI